MDVGHSRVVVIVVEVVKCSILEPLKSYICKWRRSEVVWTKNVKDVWTGSNRVWTLVFVERKNIKVVKSRIKVQNIFCSSILIWFHKFCHCGKYTATTLGSRTLEGVTAGIIKSILECKRSNQHTLHYMISGKVQAIVCWPDDHYVQRLFSVNE